MSNEQAANPEAGEAEQLMDAKQRETEPERTEPQTSALDRSAGVSPACHAEASERSGAVAQASGLLPDAVDGAKLLDELRDTIRRFVVLPEFAPETLALWILHTWAFHLRNVTAYVGIASPEKRCGKSTLLGVLQALVARPVIAANISPSAFFRVIQERRPTLLIDEADTFLDNNDELRGILNSGYSKQTAYVVRVAHQKVQTEEERAKSRERRARSEAAAASVWRKSAESEAPSALRPALPDESGLAAPNLPSEGASQHGSQLAEFSTWCPKAIAAIGQLPETLADRCIVITMQRKRPSEKCDRLKNLYGELLRLRCERFVEQNWKHITRELPIMPATLNDRAADIWDLCWSWPIWPAETGPAWRAKQPSI